MEKIKIGCLTYRKLDALTRDAIKKIVDPMLEIRVVEGLMEELIEEVENLKKEGFFVYIGGGANYGTIRNTTEIHVVEIKLTSIDYIDAIYKARQHGKRIAVVCFQSFGENYFPKLSQIMGAEIIPVCFQDPEELEFKLEAAQVEVVIGASLANEKAARLGLPGILVYPGENTIINTIAEAKEVAVTLQREKERSRIVQTIIDFAPNGVIATDQKDDIILFNPSAEKIFGVNSIEALGTPITKIIPNIRLEDNSLHRKTQLDLIHHVNENEVVTNSVPIETDGKRIGTLTIVQKASAIQQTEQRIRFLNAKKGFTAKTDFSEIIGRSIPIKEEIKKAKMYAKSKSNILIYGETGTGKELFAQSIHNFGFQQNGPFVAINCAALPENLLESELFGYEEGAFTGSRKGGKAGLFEIAHQGTIFLDEIGGISRNLQARLLRVLQEKEVMRIGGERIIPVDVRIISATNEIIEDKIPHDFRDDLYYRLNVLRISIPPLRDRENDLISMFLYFAGQHFGIDNYKSKLTEDQVNIIKYYSWPGNVRELKNVVERFSIHYKNIERYDEPVIRELILRAIGEERLFYDILKQHGILSKDVKNSAINKELLQNLLIPFSGRKSKIAEMLGMSRTTFWRKMKDLGV